MSDLGDVHAYEMRVTAAWVGPFVPQTSDAVRQWVRQMGMRISEVRCGPESAGCLPEEADLQGYERPR